MSDLDIAKYMIADGERALNDRGDCQTAIANFLGAIANLLLLQTESLAAREEREAISDSVTLFKIS